MDISTIIRALVNSDGLVIFKEYPQLLESPFDNLALIKEVASALYKYQGVFDSKDQDYAKTIVESYTSALDIKRLPVGGLSLARVIEYLSRTIEDIEWTRNIWLRLLKNPKYFVRRRFSRLLRNGLKQNEAEELWEVYMKTNDYEILRILIVSDSSIQFPIDAIDVVAEAEGQGYLLSRAMAHILYNYRLQQFKEYRKKYPVSTLYAAGFSNNLKYIPPLRLIINESQDEETIKGAMWALARLKDTKTIIRIARKYISV
jgi:hypothetical protein